MLLLTRFRIVGHSMQPQIKNGQTVLVSSIPYWFKIPRINDIVAFKVAGKILIKRITNIKNDKYFLEGDNQKDSLDSGEFGYLPRQAILGKVFCRS